jgi:glutaryl-CoA dehydrogenase
MLRTISRSVKLRGSLGCTSVTRAASTRAAFDWQNPFNIDNLLTEEEIAIRDVAHDYCQEKLYPRVLEAHRTEKFDKSILREMGEIGLLGPTLQGYDCPGVSSVAYGLITREIERVDSGFRSAMSVQSSLAMTAIYEFGTEELKQRLLPKMAKGELLGCFGLTEPNHGSDPASMETTARPHPTKKGVYLLSGSKTWISSSPFAHILIIWAKLDGVIRGFAVERSKAGPGQLDTPPIKNKMALRCSLTGMIHMDNLEVAEENMFPEVKGLKGPFTCLNSARYGIAWGVVGALEEATRLAKEYSIDRKQFGRPLATNQLIQKKLADAMTDAAYAILPCIQVGRLKDEGQAAPEMISTIKRHNCDRALANSRTLMEVFGGNATSDEYHITRIANNLQVVQTYEGQSDIHGLILGRAITGLASF